MDYLKINNVAMPTPSAMSVDLQDIDSAETGRTQNGRMVRDRVVGGAKAKRKISCSWTGLTTTKVKLLLQAMKAASFSVTYPDPYEGAIQTKTMYVGDRSAPMMKTGADSVSKIRWELTANFVEL